MEPKSPTNVKITAFATEMDAIHHANGVYWRCGATGTLEARSDYQHRLDRLEEIRAEFIQATQKPQIKPKRRTSAPFRGGWEAGWREGTSERTFFGAK